MDDPRDRPERVHFATALLIFFLWFSIAAPFTYIATWWSVTGCGSVPESCEPAVMDAAAGGAVAQGLVFIGSVAAFVALMRKQKLRKFHWVLPLALSIIVFLVAYNASQAAVDAQY